MTACCALFYFATRMLIAKPPLESSVSQPAVVRSVSVSGSRMQVALTTQVGRPYNAADVSRDVRTLWNTGRFEDVRAEVVGEDVRFRVVEARRYLLRKMLLEPSTLGVRLAIPEGTLLDRPRAEAIAREARKQLEADGYADARVQPELIPVAAGRADLHLAITPGERIHVREVQFVGEAALGPADLQHALGALRIRHILGWRLPPAYSAEAVDADLARIRSLYVSRGYLESRVRLANAEIRGKSARIAIDVDAGPRHPAASRPCDFCAALLRQRRAAERQGILDFSATLTARPDGDFATSFERGAVYRVGRIEFLGNRHFSDAMLRRNFLLEEGQLLDGRLLRKSIDRLNRTKLFEPTDASQVLLSPAGKGVADVVVRLKELKRGSWRISGPVGPPSFAGALEASVRSRLPPWGSGVFELATYTASVSVFAFAHPVLPLLMGDPRRSLLPVLALTRPYAPGEGWTSGFFIAPQLSWRAPAVAYGATQLEQRLLPVLEGDRGLTPELPVTVAGPSGDGTMFCNPPAPRFAKLRAGLGIGLRVLGAFTGI
ncbi:MAG TPA: POTRA domain-containing protein [Bryobacteraceae bacterium]|nr:POTRA domain-containing protein [Bryobacteraceae bacterium]